MEEDRIIFYFDAYESTFAFGSLIKLGEFRVVNLGVPSILEIYSKTKV